MDPSKIATSETQNPQNPQKPQKKENVLLSLVFNIILPVLLLQKGSQLDFEGAATISLFLALSFPLLYGLNDYIRNKNKNLISIMGILNILITGGLALAQLEGQWFALKEAAIPFVIGVFVLISIYIQKPFMKFMIFSTGVFNREILETHLKDLQKGILFQKQLNKSTAYLSLSFFFSSGLNYLLARAIFQPIDKSFAIEKQKEILNQQIADMNWMGVLVISVPLLFFLAFIMWDFFKKIKELTGLTFEDLVVQKP